MPTLVGTKLDKYEIQSEVGHGGMAVVYRGLDTVLDREVAVKVLHPHMAGREESRARLRREALTVAKLRHENILEIYDYSGENAAESYLVTEFIHGMTLREWLDTRWRPRPALAALIVHRLCVALGCAHKSGIVHRDIKPENVMIRSDGCIKLMDFGIAQIIDHQKLTMTGQLLGSPAYMAPELINGRPIDARTDLFAVGVMLYQLATGELPFSGRNPHEVLARIADAEYTRASMICSLVDDELEAIIDRALAREPDQRYQTADDLARDLERYLEEVGVPVTQDEVQGYFTDPDRYADQLDKRVCTALMTRADSAARAGHSARAIRLLGRVLELERDQKQAKQMLSRLRTRERAVRRMIAGAAAMATAAALGGGAVYTLWTPPEAEKVVPLEERGGQAVPLAGILRPEQPEPRPALTEATPPETPPAISDPPGPRKSTGTRPLDGSKGGGKSTTPASGISRCNVKITGLPVANARSGDYSLRVDKQQQPLKGETAEIEIRGESAVVQLIGARYQGYQSVHRRDCAAGQAVELRVRPRPAQIEFQGYPAQTTARCMLGPCPDRIVHLLGVDGFPPVDLGEEPEVELTVEFKAQGYKSKTDKLRLQPGKNAWPVNLARL